MHRKGYGFDLIFEFNPNEILKTPTITKHFYMKEPHVLHSSKSNSIEWINKKDHPLMKKLLRQLSLVKEVDTETFFSFFLPLRHPTPSNLKAMSISQFEERILDLER